MFGSDIYMRYQGHSAIITLKNGDTFSGVFFGASVDSNEPAYLLKMVQQLKSNTKGEANGDQRDAEAFVGVGDDHAMSFEHRDVNGISVGGVEISSQAKLQNGMCATS